MKLIVHPQVIREIHRAADRYAKISRAMEDRFTGAVEHALNRVRQHPKLGVELTHGERRLLVKGFPYKLIYQLDESSIFVMAIAHHKRREGY